MHLIRIPAYPNPEMACCWLQNLKKKVEFEISKKMSTWWYWRWKISSKAVDHETSSSPSSKIPNLITQIGGHQQPPLQRSLIWSYMGVEPKIGVPQNGWFIRENPIRIDDLEGKSTIFGNTLLKLQKRSLVVFLFVDDFHQAVEKAPDISARTSRQTPMAWGKVYDQTPA